MVCVNCEVELKPEKNEVRIAEMFQRNTAIYKLWDADLWQCPICKTQIIAGFGQECIVEHYQPDFEKIKELGIDYYDKEIIKEGAK